MADATSTILAAFTTKPALCVHVLMEITGLTREALRSALVDLIEQGAIRKIAEFKGDSVYARGDEAYVPITLGVDEDHLPCLFGLDEHAARTRLTMLKRMKGRLIGDWHPMLDLLIGDYERGLKNVESIRYGADLDSLKDVVKIDLEN